MLFGSGWVVGQTTIASDGLNNTSALFSLSGGAYYTGNSATGDRPASSPFAVEGTHSRGVSNGTATLISSDINTSSYTNIVLTFRLASFSISSTANGADGPDYVRVEISPDGGTTYFNTLEVIGNSNAFWAYSTGTGNASTNYDGNSSTVTFAPSAGGNRTTDGYSTVTISNLPNSANVKIKITMLNNSANERWTIDDVRITGTLSSTPTITVDPNTLSGFSVAEGNGPSSPQSFTAEGSNLTNDISIAAPTNYEISLSSGSGYTTPLTLTQSGGSVASTTIYVRLKEGLTAGTYNGETITCSSTGASDKTVTCSGSVVRTIFLSGTMNAWGGTAMTKQTDLGTSTWKLTHQESISSVEFKFRTNTLDWVNNWGRGDVVTLNSRTDWWYNPGGNGTFTATIGKYYTYIFKDVANGINGEGYVFETTATPVSLNTVSKIPAYVTPSDAVTVTITASAAPSAEEKIYVRYSIDNFTNSSYALATFVGTSGTATIPAQSDGTTVKYYALSTCLDLSSPPSDVDLATINYNTNSGANYSYLVQAPSSLIISQYYEGASNDKYIEITNLSSSTIDLSVYYLGTWSNTAIPSGSYSNGAVLTGSITAGASLIYKNSAAANPSYAVTNAVASTTATFFNGDDPVALTKGGTDWDNRVDCIYAAGTWGSDKSFYRKSTVTVGSTNISVLDGSGEWTEVAYTTVNSAVSNTTQYLGTHIGSSSWTGATNSNWGTAGNWANGGIPVSTYNVTIPNGNNVTISSSTTANCNNLTLEGNATLTIVSDENNSGSLIFNGTYSAGTGNLTYQRHMIGGKWHMTGSPLTGQAINSSFLTSNNVLSDGSGGYFMKYFNENSNSWSTNFTDATSDAFELAQAFAVKRNGDGLVNLSGTPNNAEVNATLVQSVNGWNLLANPFTSAIAANTIVGGQNSLLKDVNISNLESSYATLYVWEEGVDYPTSTNYYKVITNEGGTLGQNYVQVGQGFFVKSKSGGGTFNFAPNMQSHQTATAFKSEPIAWTRINLNAEISNAKASTRISYNENMTKGLDISYDAGLLNSYPQFALYSKLIEDNGNKFMVQCLPTDFENLVVPIGLDAQAGEIVKFSAQSENLPDNYKIVLEDRTLGVFTNLSEANAEYSIQLINESRGTGRFFVRTSIESALGIGDLDNESPYKVFTRPNNNQIVIRGNVNANTSARIYTISGKQIADIQLKQSNESLVQFNEEAGVYIVKISNEKGTTTQKFVWVK